MVKVMGVFGSIQVLPLTSGDVAGSASAQTG